MMSLYKGKSEQEKFALAMSGHKTEGFYVELGAYHSTEGSNTYHMEQDYEWSGVSFEIVEERRKEFEKNRKIYVFSCFVDFTEKNKIR